MQTIRALIADADVLVRHKLATILDSESDIAYSVVEPDGSSIMSALANGRHDVVLLDLEGAAAGGVDTFGRIRSTFPSLPVVVLVSRTPSGAKRALDALMDGAVDFVTKPENSVNVLFADGHLKKRLGPAVRMAAGSGRVAAEARHDRPSIQDESIRRTSAFAFGGCSGAVPALTEIISGLERPGAHIFIAQHMPRHFTGALAERLSLISSRPVVEAEDGALVTPDRIWLAPGGYHMCVRAIGFERRLQVHRGRRESGCRPSIDILFRSVAETYRERAAGVILSGCPADGIRGCRAIRAAGGRCLVQDRASALVPNLPRAVISEGLATTVLFPDAIAAIMNRGASDGRRSRSMTDRAARFRNTVKDHERRN